MDESQNYELKKLKVQSKKVKNLGKKWEILRQKVKILHYKVKIQNLELEIIKVVSKKRWKFGPIKLQITGIKKAKF